MTRLRTLSLSLAVGLMALSPLAAEAKAPPAKVKQTAAPVATLAMDGTRVAYASGARVYVWNTLTGATTVMKGNYSSHTSEIAIAGTRVAWITRYVVGNSYETTERLFTAPVGGNARLLRSARHRHGGDLDAWHGAWVAGVVGSGSTLATSTWWTDGTVSTAQRLSLITPTGMRQIAAGPGAIISESADGSRIAVLRSYEAWPTLSVDPEAQPSVGIYSAQGTLLKEIVPSSAKEIALTGDRLVVLTATKTLEVYDWRTGTLEHMWPVAAATPRLQAGHLDADGRLAAYSVDPRYSTARNVHVLSLTTGKDAVIGTGRSGSLGYYGRDAAIGPRGLVYAVTYHEHGKLGTPQHGRLVFVPTAKLLAAVAAPKAHTPVSTGLIDVRAAS